ncbi:DUF1080 domain-containing protein [Catenovulum sp. 2E275]|uniref:3-keto-disaccharide hydrolase n=1 Tax=Catenovulum sp. 2E275 TaxID=2980497 RepID=UPI0021CE726A|nr:DUF1080 domain-containing protein [Catenovulum sp. 2E275]MCU4677619.1 DUF1080 domain-containing protein [Catenovulum sp. 2E275]
MKYPLKLSVKIALVALLTSCATPKPQTPSLDQTRWQNVYPYGQAEFINGTIELISTDNWFYLTKQSYRDFELELDVKMPDTTEYSNSGIIFRAQIKPFESGHGFYAYGYQAEVDPSDRKWSGGLYEQATQRQWLYPLHPTRSAPDSDFKQNLLGEWSSQQANAYQHLAWNHYKIKAVGPEIKIWVNGVLTTHVIDNKSAEGFIGIQHHGSELFKKTGDKRNKVVFKNITITEL